MDVVSTALTPALATGKQTPAEGPETDPGRSKLLESKARGFEAAFIAEMLKHAGFEKALSGDSGFGGETFSQMLVETYAQSISDAGGFGIAEKIYDQLKDNIK